MSPMEMEMEKALGESFYHVFHPLPFRESFRINFQDSVMQNFQKRRLQQTELATFRLPSIIT